jgi:hypothetical protein
MERMEIFFDSLGFPRNFMNRFGNSSSEYSFEELADIVDRLNIDTSSKYDAKVLSYLFDLGAENDIKRKQESLDYFSENRNNGIPVPVVVDINGKLITGEVYYSNALNAYAKDEDDFIDAGDEWLSIQANEEGILDDDQPDWVSDNWDMLDIYEVDLDKEYLDDNNGWTKR